ncbi:hypothetical protein M3Y97_00275300 [Aphelenchoides bicaudatus]|nr:hypothetical protein M3Y97_00275300 [Aphelenchoides bicaudatus]
MWTTNCSTSSTKCLILICFLLLDFTVAVHWVPIVDRNEDPDKIADPIEAAFKKTNQLDQIQKDKFQRISKMLNNSLDAQAQELREGNKKLEDLKHASYSPRIGGHLIIATVFCRLFLNL